MHNLGYKVLIRSCSDPRLGSQGARPIVIGCTPGQPRYASKRDRMHNLADEVVIGLVLDVHSATPVDARTTI